MCNKLEINTGLGTLVAEVHASDLHYPGIAVSLVQPRRERPINLALVECPDGCQSSARCCGQVVTHVWGETARPAPTASIVHAGVVPDDDSFDDFEEVSVEELVKRMVKLPIGCDPKSIVLQVNNEYGRPLGVLVNEGFGARVYSVVTIGGWEGESATIPCSAPAAVAGAKLRDVLHHMWSTWEGSGQERYRIISKRWPEPA